MSMTGLVEKQHTKPDLTASERSWAKQFIRMTNDGFSVLHIPFLSLVWSCRAATSHTAALYPISVCVQADVPPLLRELPFPFPQLWKFCDGPADSTWVSAIHLYTLTKIYDGNSQVLPNDFNGSKFSWWIPRISRSNLSHFLGISRRTRSSKTQKKLKLLESVMDRVAQYF